MKIYETVTNRILNQLANGVVPWRKTWVTGLPKSLTTGKEYRGINILILGASDFTSRYWVTYREAQRLGGQVRKGERASPVIYWHWRTEQELKKLRERTGRVDLAPCLPFTSAVFNLDQVNGITRPEDDVPQNVSSPVERADAMFAVMPNEPEIVHSVSEDPCYKPRSDKVILPHLSQFEDANAYYSTLFHELVHATGHPSRLNRFANREGDRHERYSFEELVAEFGASFLCAFTGISNPSAEAQSVSYIDGWSSVFRRDSHILVNAASAAQRAADYIRGKVPSAEAADQGSTQHGTQAVAVGA